MTDKGKGPKPFLADESELDAWDSMFDALHETSPADSAPALAPAPSPPAKTTSRVPETEPSLDDGSLTVDEVLPAFRSPTAELDEQMTLDRAVPAARRREESDFSDVDPQAEPPVEEDEVVYTSASRPSSPPKTMPPPTQPPPTQQRRTAAIIRRTPAPGVPQTRISGPVDSQRQSPSQGLPAVPSSAQNPFAETPTRVADVNEIEKNAHAARSEARSKAPTAPPPFAFTPTFEPEAPPPEDDYEIEIGSDSGISEMPVPEAPIAIAPRRTVANVIRRSVAMPAVPPPPRASSEGVVPVERRSDTAIPVDVGEDDFSDVAAAVGAHDDPAMDMPEAQRRAPTPRLQDTIDAEDAVIDDHLPTSVTDEYDEPVEHSDYGMTEVQGDGGELDPASSDVYVPMAPRLEDALDIQEMHEPQPSSTLPDSPYARESAEHEVSHEQELAEHYPRVRTPTSVPPLREPSPTSTLPGMRAVADVRPAPRLLQERPSSMADAPELEPTIDLEAVQLPEQVQPLATSHLDEEAATALLVYEREISSVDESSTSAALRVESGRLSERLGDVDRARSHYDAALLADPRATAALRGLRRIARASSDLGEATRQLDAEIAVAGALEKRPLSHYRVDLLLASGEQDLARVAVGELLDTAPSDARALLAQLELAFLDGRADEFGTALEQLAHAVTDNELRAAVQSARGLLANQQGDAAGAATWFSAAAESDPGSLAARLGAIHQAAAGADRDTTARAYLDLSRHVEMTDPTISAALALRAQHWASGELAAQAAQQAATAMPADPLVLRTAAETTAKHTTDLAAAGAAFAAWASSAATPAERGYAAARAAELDPAHAAELWAAALQYDPGDDYAAAQLRTSHVAAEQLQLAIEVDLSVASDVERDRARLRAAFGMISQGQLDGAIDLLERGRAARPGALALTEALAEALAAAGRWSDRARLLAELAETPGEMLDRDVAQLRSALAWEEAASAAVEGGDAEEVARASTAALGAWNKVIERSSSPAAHAAATLLAARLGDHDVLVESYARMQVAERSPWSAGSIALRRARLLGGDLQRAHEVLREGAANLDDPRRTLALVVSAARRGELGDAASALDERAAQLPALSGEIAALRLRAAQLALDTGDATRAIVQLVRVGQALPGLTIVQDLLSAARRRAGERGASGPHLRPGDVQSAASGDAFAGLVRDGDLAANANDGPGAIALYQRALELRPGDPLAAVPLVRIATQSREPAAISALALAQLRAAEASGDAAGKAEAYELLARIDKDLRDDAGAAQVALESASQADPKRVDLMHRLEREYTVGDQISELLRLRRAELEQIPPELAQDRAAILMDMAVLAERDHLPDLELAEIYRSSLAADPRRRFALLRLESIVRRAGASQELAHLEEQIATYFEGDPRTQAAFFTRAGETLAELGQIDAAVQRFGKAEGAQPGHLPALEGWRQAALKGQLWLDVAEAATRAAAAIPDAEPRAAMHHFAGVVLMDKALVGDQAMAAFRRALEANPGHKDAFLRMRILLDEDARHDELAILLDNRLVHERDPRTRVEIHRALAKLCRDFLDQRDQAKHHYREILADDPNDLRSHAAIADIAWEQGAWQEAADALIARAKLERDADVLKTLCFRLGLIYADRLVDVPMALKAFQRALTYQPDDENTLVRLADLATQAGEWKLALGACERLVKNEQDPEKRAQHLSRVARIFRQGFGDMKRAERALNLALDGAPTSDEALTQLVQFYRDAGDMTSVRVHLNRVAGTMRVRLQQEARDGVAYRVIARAMSARGAAGVAGSQAIARSAAELADLLGASGDPERLLLDEVTRVDLSQLLRPEADEVLFPHGVQTELRQIFTLLGDRIAKHVGVDLRAYGVGRGDRLRAKDSSVAAHAQDVASGLGFGEIDVYVSARQPYAMVVEPTSPVSLVLGQAIAQRQDGGRSVRFAAGAALKLAQSSLAIAARLAPDDLGVLVVALLRLFQGEFPGGGLDETTVAGQMQKLKRLIPSGLMTELKPFAFAIDAARFDHRALSRDLKITGLRAGLVAAGSLLAGLVLLAAQAETDVPSFLADPVAQGLVSFALSEDHATVAR